MRSCRPRIGMFRRDALRRAKVRSYKRPRRLPHGWMRGVKR